jgi:hypothetical protein
MSHTGAPQVRSFGSTIPQAAETSPAANLPHVAMWHNWEICIPGALTDSLSVLPPRSFDADASSASDQPACAGGASHRKRLPGDGAAGMRRSYLMMDETVREARQPVDVRDGLPTAAAWVRPARVPPIVGAPGDAAMADGR